MIVMPGFIVVAVLDPHNHRALVTLETALALKVSIALKDQQILSVVLPDTIAHRNKWMKTII